jgi:hypothetical protein
MSPEDRAHYGVVPNTAPLLDSHPSPKTDSTERKEQASFANWLLLQNSNGRKIPFCWHATNACSKATPGTPDFWVGVNRRSLWLEFKRDPSCKLTPEQEEFRDCCVCQGIEWHLVYGAAEAIGIMEKAVTVCQVVSDTFSRKELC